MFLFTGQFVEFLIEDTNMSAQLEIFYALWKTSTNIYGLTHVWTRSTKQDAERERKSTPVLQSSKSTAV